VIEMASLSVDSKSIEDVDRNRSGVEVEKGEKREELLLRPIVPIIDEEIERKESHRQKSVVRG